MNETRNASFSEASNKSTSLFMPSGARHCATTQVATVKAAGRQGSGSFRGRTCRHRPRGKLCASDPVPKLICLAMA